MDIQNLVVISSISNTGNVFLVDLFNCGTYETQNTKTIRKELSTAQVHINVVLRPPSHPSTCYRAKRLVPCALYTYIYNDNDKTNDDVRSAQNTVHILLCNVACVHDSHLTAFAQPPAHNPHTLHGHFHLQRAR